MTKKTQPKHFSPGEGMTYKLGRITLTFKTTAADNAGAYTLCDVVEPPDSGAGLHRHATYDETTSSAKGTMNASLGTRCSYLVRAT
jgi:hypothetical protein